MSALIANPTPAEERLIARYAALKEDPRRTRAFEAFAAAGLPHRRVEGWRWSDVRAALKPVEMTDTPELADPFAHVDAPVFRFTGAGFEPPAKRPAGVMWSQAVDAPAFSAAEELPMGALAAALSDSPSAVVIEIAASLPQPIRLVFEGAADRFAHVVVLVREGAAATILESHLAHGGFSSVALEYSLEANASVQRVMAQAAGPQAVQVVSAKVGLKAESRFEQASLAFGAKLCRMETRVTHNEAGASATLNAAYLLGDKRHADMTTHVRHAAPDCETRQSTKGAVKAGGKGAFQGKFHVTRSAQKTDAAMAHNALLLEDGAEVNAKPELEIYADDVQCAHGNTAGALDANALFYMRQRGIPLKEAQALLTQSFIADAFEVIVDEDVKDILLKEAREWLMASL